MAEVGGALLSAFLQFLVDRLASPEVLDFLRGRKLIGRLLSKLRIKLLAVNVLVEDAEEKQATNDHVKKWHDELKDAVFDAEDILDKVATQALQRKLDAEFETTAVKVRNLTYASLSLYKLRGKIEEVLDKLTSLADQKDVLGLREGVAGVRTSKRLPTTCLVEESGNVGRNDEKEEIVKEVLSYDGSGRETSVIAIVGMGGIGKTTLAQLVYNDERVKEHFDLKAWICVSDEFDLFKVTKAILEAVTSSTSEVRDLNRLQVSLNERLTGKKFVLVIDDVWNNSFDDWEALSKPLKSGAPGSKVIVTTRHDGVSSAMRACSTHYLDKLPEEDCWSLFAKYAFDESNLINVHPELEVVGRQIAKKCEGLPLAAKAIGALLWSKTNVDEWNNILHSELWNQSMEETQVLPALRLSYKYLPSHLKRCFAYCAIFPKDCAFTKDQLVLLWTAEGFLQEVGNKTMEEIGEDYFHDLVSQSLFQRSTEHEQHFIMHDLINDLAKFVHGQFSFRLKVDQSHDDLSKTRYLSYMRTEFDTFEKFEPFSKVKKLRTFLPLELGPKYCWCHLTEKVLRDLLPTLSCLRVLSLSHYRNMNELPESVEKMKHLRYLDISSTQVKRLPQSICKLHNLQTLKLSGCADLMSLPRDMHKLVNLRHLDITETGITEMPMHLGNLKGLQTLSKFIVSKHRGSGLGELGKLANLRGALSILELQNVESSRDAVEAKLKNKKYLENLELCWNASPANNSGSQRSVLDNLQPHTNLKSLTVNYYSGECFPNWVGHHSFSNIASLRLENCKHCCSLPPLGQLHSLQNLYIVGFPEIITVGSEFYGAGFLSIKPFGSLKVLTFEDMSNWETWFHFGTKHEGGAFPSLGELNIKHCPKLTGGFSIHLLSLARLEIHCCPELVISLRRAPVLRELELMRCNEVLLKELPVGIERLKIEGFDLVESLSEELMNSNSCLQELEISNGFSLVSLPTSILSSTLRKLKIEFCRKFELPTHLDCSFLEELKLYGCDSLRSFPLDLFPNLKTVIFFSCENLESLTAREKHEQDLMTSLSIYYCRNFVSFPKAGLRAPNLTSLDIEECKSLRSLPDKMRRFLPSLDYLRVSDCPEIESFPEGGLPSKLSVIWIMNCDKLFANRMGWGLQTLTFVRHVSIAYDYGTIVSFPEMGLLPSNLTALSIWNFPKLESLDKEGLQHLTSLEDLTIWNCPKLKCMPEGGLPASLSCLQIIACPLLEKQWQRRKGKEWRKVAHIPYKGMNFKLTE